MIVQFLLSLGSSLVAWIGELMPEAELPTDVADPGDWLVSILSMGQGLGTFVDWTFLGICIALTSGVWVTSMTVKMFRSGVTHLPWFGGRG